MRIVAVSPTYAPCIGGAERLLQGVAERLVARGHDVTVLTFDCRTQRDFQSVSGAGLPRDELLNGVRIVRVSPAYYWPERALRWWTRRRGGWRTTNWALGDALEFPLGRPSGLRAIRPLLGLKADVISTVNWGFGVSYWGGISARLRRVPQVAVPILHIHSEWAALPIYGRMLRGCDGIIVLTEAERDFVAARGGRCIVVAGAGVAPERFLGADGADLRRRYGLQDRPVVGFVGRQDTHKGLLTLIDAMQQVWQHVPDAVLLLAGPEAHRDAEVSQRLESLARENSGQVLCIDDFRDAEGPSIMAAVDVLAMPSVEEGFGMVTIEAWMCRKPVIGADIAPTRCVIENGMDGWLVEPGNAGDLAGRILQLLADPQQRRNFGERGCGKVLQKYTWERVTNIWEAAYRRAIAAAPGNSTA
jgi:glycosyltransferase involved in cell wall biosynthesis